MNLNLVCLLLFQRLIDINSGSIEIDGVDIGSIATDALRDQLAIIPQDPVLFSGSIRMNLDPWDLFSDAQLWEVCHSECFASSSAT